MKFLRMIGRLFVTYLFRTFIILLPASIALATIIGNPTYIETVLRKSGVYSHFTDAAITQSVTNAQDQNTKNLLSDPTVQAAVKQSFTPEVLQNGSEQVIEGFYAWMQGKTTDIQFSVDLSQPKQKLEASLKAYALARAQSLPTCTLQQLQTFSPNTDILSIPCLPPGFSAEQAAEQFSSDTIGSVDFLSDTKITSADLQKESGGQSFTAANEWVPGTYRMIMIGPWVMGVMALLTGVGVFFLHDQRRRALKVLAWSFVGTGVFLLISAGMYSLFADRVTQTQSSNNLPALDTSITSAIMQLLHDAVVRIGIVGGIYCLIGVVIFVLIRRLKIGQPVIPAVPSNTSTLPNVSNTAEVNKTEKEKQL